MVLFYIQKTGLRKGGEREREIQLSASLNGVGDPCATVYGNNTMWRHLLFFKRTRC